MEKRPNLLFLMTDHQRADEIGMIQCEREITPHINRLAKEGVRFTRAYNTCPLCVPARTALATGIYPTQNGVVFNDWKGENAGAYETIHTLFKKAGYRVGHVGVDHIRVKPMLRDRGLDFFISQEEYEKWAAVKGLDVRRAPGDLTQVEEYVRGTYEKRLYSGRRVTKWSQPKELLKDRYFESEALRFLNECGEEPFALFVYLWAPHPPLCVPEPFFKMYNPKGLDLPDNVNRPAKDEPVLRRKGVPARLAEGASLLEWRKVWAAHLGLSTMADEIFGNLLSRIDRLGLQKDTCVIVTADHGDHLGQHAMYQKMEMYQEAVRVPLIIRFPGLAPAVCEGVASHLDVLPTLCQLFKVGKGSLDFQGRSLVPYMKGEKPDDGRMVFSQYSGNPDYGDVRRAAISSR